MHRPYVGVTGFKKVSQVVKVLNVVPDELQPQRLLMVGALASYRDLVGQAFYYKPEVHPRKPALQEIASIFTDDRRVLNLIHYHSNVNESLHRQLILLHRVGGENLMGFQLNMVWPDIAELAKFTNEYPHMQIVLQISEGCLADKGYDPIAVATAVKDYVAADTIDYVLFDLSGGTGRDLNPSKLYPYLGQIAMAALDVGLGVAGGLCANNLENLRQLMTQFPDLSFDAEGRLMNLHGGLSVHRARRYVERAFELFG